jgi:hypothetical protein
VNDARAARATRLAAASAFFVAFALALLPLSFGLYFAGVDLARVDVPLVFEVRELLARGQSLWLSPSTGQGAPLLTSPNAQLLYPSRWFSFLFSPELGVHLHASLHIATMAAGTAWLARTFRMGVVASSASGLMFALSGTALDLVTHSTYLAGGAWLPIVWAGARRLKRRRDHARAFAAIVVALTMLLLAGEPHACAIGCGLVVVECGVFAFRQRVRARAACVTATLAMLFAGVMGCVLWLPVLAELALSGRDAGQALPMSTVLARSFSPSEWPALVWPALLTDVGQGMQSFRSLIGDDHTRRLWNHTPYVGGLCIAACVLGARVRRTRVALVVAVVAVLLSLGPYGGLLPLLVKIAPPLGVFRFPAKYLVVATLAAWMVVGVVLCHAARSEVWRRRLAVALAVIVIVHGTAALALIVGKSALDAVPTPVPSGGIGAELLPLSSLWLTRVLQALAFASLQFVIVLFASPTRLAPQARRTLLVTLVAFEMLAFAPLHVVLTPAFSVVPSPLSALARADTVFKTPLCSDAHTYTVAMYHGGTTDRVEHARRHMRLGLSEMQTCHGLSSVVDYSPGASRLAVSLVESLEATPSLARALGCTTWLTPHGEAPQGMRQAAWVDARGLQAAHLDGIRLMVIDDPLPEVAVARAPRLLRTEADVKAALSAGDDPWSLVDDPLLRLEADAVLPSGEEVVALALRSEDPHVVTVRAEGAGAALLVVRTSFRVGWTATQQGRAAKVVRVGGMFIGVIVDDVTKGAIELRYEPPRFAAGLALWVAGALSSVLVFAQLRRRGRKSHPRA